MTFVGTNIASASPFAMLLLGVSNANWLGVPLPLALDGLGMTGCALQTSLELTPVAAVSAGAASWDLALPPDPQLVGASLFGQVLAADPGVNPAGLVVSRPVAVTTGW
jgi:hypothetical protein